MTDAGPSGGAGRRGGARTVARLAAVQALYQIEMTGQDAEKVVEEFDAHRLVGELDGIAIAPSDRAYFRVLVLGVVEARDDLDAALAAALTEGWPLPRLDSVVRAILRAGAFELSDRPDVPAVVAISEYVDLARDFFAGKEPNLVNGVLDRLARRFRAEEMESHDNG